MNYIKEEDVDVEKSRIKWAHVPGIDYDMYYVILAMKDGSKKEIKTFCEKGTIPDLTTAKRIYGEEKIKNQLKDFFIYRLIGKNSLLVKEGRDDYIYLGTNFHKNGYVANRFSKQSNGKNGQENFDDKLFNLKLKIEALFQMENNEPQSNGKSYVMSDIHGMYDLYKEAMSRLTDKDHVYIIGDVIDRGDDGIKIIQDIIRRQNNPESNPEITFLLGNHEEQFIESISNISRTGLSFEEIWNTTDKYGCLTKQSTELLHNKGMSDIDIENFRIWLEENDGIMTYYNFAITSRKERQDIYKFLLESYVILPQTIKNKDYLFVHAAPLRNLEIIEKMKKSGQGYKFLELKSSDERFMLEARKKKKNDEVESAFKLAKKNGFTTICGHTPTNNRDIEKNDDEGYIRIDVGCGHGTKLALYCIDDERVEYITQKEINDKDDKKAPSL